MLLPVLLLVAQGAAASPAAFVIEHKPVNCVVAGKHPRLDATAPAGADVASARVYFQGKSREWYSVAMKAEGAVLTAALPSPKKDLAEFHYYVEATARDMSAARTPDVSARVVGSAAECGKGVVAAVTTATSLLVQGPAGAAAVPAGFAPSGLAAAGVGGGISGTTLAVAGAAVAGAGAVAATKLGGGSVTYAGPFSADLTTILFNGCRRVEQRTMIFTVDLPENLSGQGRYDMDGEGRAVVLPASNCGIVAGTSSPFGLAGGTFSASGSTISISETSNPTSSMTRIFSFQGTLAGNTIQGTATLTERGSEGGVVVTATVSVPLTLTKR